MATPLCSKLSKARRHAELMAILETCGANLEDVVCAHKLVYSPLGELFRDLLRPQI